MGSSISLRSRAGLIRPLFFCIGFTLACSALAAPPPLPPPPPSPPVLPGGATPGGASPVMPPPTIPIPGNNLDLSVPPVYERPLGAEEGDRVFVKRFVITGVVGDRKAGISPSDIQAQVDTVFAGIEKIVEQQRLTKENLEKQGPEGFTPEEQDKIIKFMQGAVKTSSPEDQQKQYQAFIQELMLERLQRLQGLTIGQLQQVADVVTKYYHDKGYFLARAVIPAQEIKDGVVNIRVLEGRLEKVESSGNKMYSSAVLQKPFEPLLGELVTIGRTENALLTLTKYPGLSAAGVFRPGSDIGTTDIVVNVNKESPFNGKALYDNEGTRFTGRRRLLGSLDWNNPTGASDVLDVTVLRTFSPHGSTFGDLRYDHPFFDAYDRWAFDVNRNSFDAGTSVGGVSKTGTLSFEHDYERSREQNIIGTIDLSRKRADTQTGGITTARDDLAVLGFQLNVDSVNTVQNTISTGYIRFDHGFPGILGVPTDAYVLNAFQQSGKVGAPSPPPYSRSGSNNKPNVPSFNRLTLNYQLYKNLPAGQGLLLRLSGQYSNDLLSSLEQTVMGGSENVRAAPASQFLVDKGGFASLEYSVPAPGFSDKHAFGSYSWGQLLRFRVFTDAAEGFVNHPAVGSINRHYLAGNGVGLVFAIPGSLTANLMWARLNGGARTTSNNTLDPNSIKDASETWFDITYNF